MYKKTIKYKDFDGNLREEDFFFNLTEFELMEMEFVEKGGLSATIDFLVKTKDTEKLIRIFKEMLLKAYGEKSPDGKYFMKNDEIRSKFACTQAYSDLFMLFATDDKAAAEFVNGIIPSEFTKLKEEVESGNKPEFELV